MNATITLDTEYGFSDRERERIAWLECKIVKSKRADCGPVMLSKIRFNKKFVRCEVTPLSIRSHKFEEVAAEYLQSFNLRYLRGI